MLAGNCEKTNKNGFLGSKTLGTIECYRTGLEKRVFGLQHTDDNDTKKMNKAMVDSSARHIHNYVLSKYNDYS